MPGPSPSLQKPTATELFERGPFFGPVPSKEAWASAKQIAAKMKGKPGDSFKIAHKDTQLSHSFVCQIDSKGKPHLIAVQRSEILGSGQFGKTKLGIDEKGNPRAIKVQAGQAKQDLTNETRIEQKVGRDLGSFDRVSDTKGSLNYQVKPFLGVSLKDLLAEGQLSEKDKLTIMHKTAKALNNLHAQGILHNDLNPGNILVRKDKSGKISVSLIDFGNATLLNGRDKVGFNEEGFPKNRHFHYSPPEVLSSNTPHPRQVSTATDVYQLGRLFDRDLGMSMPGLLEKNPEQRKPLVTVIKDIENQYKQKFSLQAQLKKDIAILEKDFNQGSQALETQFNQAFTTFKGQVLNWMKGSQPTPAAVTSAQPPTQAPHHEAQGSQNAYQNRSEPDDEQTELYQNQPVNQTPQQEIPYENEQQAPQPVEQVNYQNNEHEPEQVHQDNYQNAQSAPLVPEKDDLLQHTPPPIIHSSKLSRPSPTMLINQIEQTIKQSEQSNDVFAPKEQGAMLFSSKPTAKPYREQKRDLLNEVVGVLKELQSLSDQGSKDPQAFQTLQVRLNDLGLKNDKLDQKAQDTMGQSGLQKTSFPAKELIEKAKDSVDSLAPKNTSLGQDQQLKSGLSRPK